MLEGFCWPQPDDAVSEKVVADVRKHGWSTINVFGDQEGPGFSYTVGLYLAHRCPELIAFGLPPRTAHGFFGGVFELAAKGEPVPPQGRYDGLAQGLPVWFRPILFEHREGHLGFANWFYASLPRPYPVSQMVWPDRAGRFPWQAGFSDEFRGEQPFLWTPGPLPPKPG